MMDQEIKAQWVAALRSGEYKQGEGYLNRTHIVSVEGETEPVVENRLCCLGVLCELAVKAGVTGVVSEDYDEGTTYGTHNDSSNTYPPYGVQIWAGLEVPNPVVYQGTHRNSLSFLNDDGETFETIANLIENQL